MKCLSVQQPFAWLIVHGYKDVENRTWWTRYRGSLLIHASKRIDVMSLHWYQERFEIPRLPLGCIVGQVEIVDCTLKRSSDWHSEGCYGWYLRNPVAFDQPIRYCGQLGLFDVPMSRVPELRAA